MNVSTRLGLGVFSTLVAFGCGWHTPPPTGANGHRAEAPTGLVAALPADVHPALLLTANECEAGDVSACNRMAFTFAYGLSGDTNRRGFAEDVADRVVAPTGAAHGHAADGAHGEAHGEAHGDDHGGGHGPTSPVYGTVEPNPALGAQLYQWSCDVGFPTGCTGLADLYHEGRGVERDGARASQLLRQACEMGMPSACYQLAHSGAADASELLATACTGFYTPACDAMQSGH